MRALLPMSILVFTAVFSSAQNIAVNTTGSPADASALLDVSSTNKGILIPRMMPWDRTNIQNPANGLLVYDLSANSFWYYSNGWHEIGSGGSMSGPAGGDLSGSYPTPTVVKLQNLDVAFGVPFDKQVLKWDALNNNWKGHNDSLFLPYNVTYGSPGSLFGITNNNFLPGATAILGKRGAGSGINPAATMGVWGDNSGGLGVLGSSNTGIGVYGLSSGNHGIYGYSVLANFAGIKGSHASENGIGVMGEIGQTGIGVYGLGTGSTSIAGKFENTDLNGVTVALDVQNLGLGVGASFLCNNPNNGSSTVFVSTLGTGDGVYALHAAAGANNSAIKGLHQGSGVGIYGKSDFGIAGKMIIDNSTSTGVALHASTVGKGTAGVFIKDNTTGSISDVHEPAVLIDNNSKGVALKVKSLHSPSVNAGIDVQYAGQSFGVNINSTKGGLHAYSSTDATVILAENNSGGTAISGFGSNGSGATAVKGEHTGSFGIGVLGINNSTHGIGVKGMNNSSSEPAVFGINSGGGGGVYGVNASAFGAGVIGDAGEQHGIGGMFISDNSTSQVSPAIYALVSSLSNAAEILINNEANANTALQITHQGTGNLAEFINENYDGVIFSHNGNITAHGTVTVKDNKGIVRNSSSTQKRMETLTVDLIYFNMPQGGSTSTTVVFAQSFSSPPVVSLGNINSGFTGPCDKMTVQIKNVTTTGCTVTMYNPGVSGNPDVSGTWNLLAIGNE